MSIFSSISLRRPKRNTFDLSFENKLTCNFGQLIPVLCQDVLPGDKFKLRTEHLVRFAPMAAPIMQAVDVCFHYFFVPNRLIYKNWEKFIVGETNKNITEQDVEPDPSWFDYPTVSSNVSNFGSFVKNGTLADYLNFPTFDELPLDVQRGNYKVDWLPFRAYNLIYNEYYRDQNLEAPLPVPTGGYNSMYDYEDTDGVVKKCNFSDLMTIRYRSFKKDYFTSALPWTQRGPKVQIPLSMTSQLDYIGEGMTPIEPSTPGNSAQIVSPGTLSVSTGHYLMDSSGRNVNVDVSETHEISSHTTDGTINDLRTAFKVQEWLERNARAGARYIEQIFSHFGVRSSDARLQRPEYLGGSKAPVVINEVTQTSSTVDGSEIGYQAGQGTSLSRSYIFNRRFEEHGFIIGIMSIMPRASYFQGYPRKYSRRTYLDYYFPEFAHLGEQAIKNEELFYDIKSNNNNDGTFGYTPRYAEYRFNNDEIHGAFRGNMDFYHMARRFNNLPGLNKEFISTDDDSLYRPFNVQSQDEEHLYCQIYHDLKASRLIPRYGTPTL